MNNPHVKGGYTPPKTTKTTKSIKEGANPPKTTQPKGPKK